MVDLEAIKAKWLNVCGACDAGIGECSHPSEDYRPVMLDLVREVEKLRAAEPAYWIYATRHTGRVFVDDDPENAGTLHQEVPDEDFARMRLDWWRTNRPDVASTLLRRPVFFGDWEVVDADS